MFRRLDSSPPDFWNSPSASQSSPPPIGAHSQAQNISGPTAAHRAIGNPGIPIGAQKQCDKCGITLTRQATAPNAQNVVLYFWSACACSDSAELMQKQAVQRARERLIARDAALLGDPNASRIKRFDLATFEPERLSECGGLDPYTTASAWLAEALDESKQPRMLWFYSPIKGCGKTHLAAGLYWEAQKAGKRVAFVEELSYLSLYWNMPLGEAREQLVKLPAEDAWLTVLDDMGRREPGGKNGVLNAWGDVIGRRYLSERWTIVTSNYTPEELERRGTIDEASLSRICEMTRGAIIVFDGVDQRRKAS